MSSRLRRGPRSLRVLVAATAAFALAVPAAPAFAQTPPRFPDAEYHAPTSVPDRVVLTPTEEPATSQAVSWRTDASVATPIGQIAPISGGPGFKADAMTVPAVKSTPVMADLGYTQHFHTVEFEGLEPDSSYLYRVGDGTNFSEWFEFVTAAEDASDPWSFVYFGDAQNDVKEHWSRVIRKAFADRPAAKVMLHAGDLVNTADSDQEWGDWFHGGGWISGQLNYIATPGNHEYRSGTLAPQWQPQFSFPDNGPDASGTPYETHVDDTVYYVDYQGVRFVSLNSNCGSDVACLGFQAEWLDDVLSDNDQRWTVVTFHHPIWSAAEGRNNPALRDMWQPILEEHGVDLVLQGHDHTYARGNAVSTRGTARSHNGTVYVVSVSGPKMYEFSPVVWNENGGVVRSWIENTQLYQLVDVEEGQLRYQARTATGEWHDGFTIRKSVMGSKIVTDDHEDRRATRG